MEDPDQDRDAAILRTCSYHRRDFDLVLIRSQPHETQAGRQLLTEPPPVTSAAGLGILDRLPQELIGLILDHLTVSSYLHLRQVSRGARAILTTSHRWSLVAQHGIEALRAVLRSGQGDNFTVADLHHALIQRDCVICGAFGGFFFIPTASRVCLRCIRTSRHLGVMDITKFGHIVSLSKAQIDRYLSDMRFRTINSPGSYSMLQSPRAGLPHALIAERAAAARLRLLGLLPPARDRELRKMMERGDDRFMGSVAMPWCEVRDGTVKLQRGVCCKGCQVEFERDNLRWREQYEALHSESWDFEDYQDLSENPLFQEFVAELPWPGLGLPSTEQVQLHPPQSPEGQHGTPLLAGSQGTEPTIIPPPPPPVSMPPPPPPPPGWQAPEREPLVVPSGIPRPPYDEDESGFPIIDYNKRDVVYSYATFIAHFRSCKDAQQLWEQSEGGTKAVEEPEMTRNGGHFHRYVDEGFRNGW